MRPFFFVCFFPERGEESSGGRKRQDFFFVVVCFFLSRGNSSVNRDESDRSDGLDFADVLTRDEEGALRELREPLERRERRWFLTALDCRRVLALEPADLADAGLVADAALGRGNVLDANVDALPDQPVSDLLVHLDTDCAPRDVPHAAGVPDVEAVRHSTVDSAVHVDVDVIAELVSMKISRKPWHSVLPERTVELAPSPRPVTIRVNHLEIKVLSLCFVFFSVFFFFSLANE